MHDRLYMRIASCRCLPCSPVGGAGVEERTIQPEEVENMKGESASRCRVLVLRRCSRLHLLPHSATTMKPAKAWEARSIMSASPVRHSLSVSICLGSAVDHEKPLSLAQNTPVCASGEGIAPWSHTARRQRAQRRGLLSFPYWPAGWSIARAPYCVFAVPGCCCYCGRDGRVVPWSPDGCRQNEGNKM